MEHRWKLSCDLEAEDLQDSLTPVLAPLVEEGWNVFEQVDTGGFMGWTLRMGEAAVGVAAPEPLGPRLVMVRSVQRDLGERIVEAITRTGPLEQAEIRHEEIDLPPI